MQPSSPVPTAGYAPGPILPVTSRFGHVTIAAVVLSMVTSIRMKARPYHAGDP